MNEQKFKDSIFKKLYYKLPFGIQAYLSKIIFKPKFGKKMVFSKGIKWYYGEVSFGRGCRIARDSCFSNVTVGNYTIFASNFRILDFVHCFDVFSVHGGIKTLVNIKADEIIVPENIQPRVEYYPQTIIGSDVWIGEYVTLKGGIRVGDGAVIAANSTVTHDVPPFAVVAGCPAKFVKWRLPQDRIDLMMTIKWWDWPEEKIAKEYNRLCEFDLSLIDEI